MSQVEHVVREEKTIAAFELIEIYCELIAARLPIIESQKYVNVYKILVILINSILLLACIITYTKKFWCVCVCVGKSIFF